jgi:hypothetical protein
MDLLVSLYKEQKKGDRRRKFADIDFEEFGRVRYLAGVYKLQGGLSGWPLRSAI